jgi:hypothetical protein
MSVLPPNNFTSDIAAYEAGELDEDQVLDLFQRLVDTGLAWQLQSSYGRTAQAMITAGLIALPEEIELDPETEDAYRQEKRDELAGRLSRAWIMHNRGIMKKHIAIGALGTNYLSESRTRPE